MRAAIACLSSAAVKQVSLSETVQSKNLAKLGIGVLLYLHLTAQDEHNSPSGT